MDNQIKNQTEVLRKLNPVDRILNLTNSWGVKVARDPWSDNPLIWYNNSKCFIAIEVSDDANKEKLISSLEESKFNWTEPFKMSNGNWLIKATYVSSFKPNKGNIQ